MIALILNTVLNHCISNYNEPVINLTALIIADFKTETMFSCFQMAKILHFYGYDKINCEFILENCNVSIMNTGKFKQGSNIFAYYILKTVLLYKIENFIKFIRLVNKDQCNPLNFKDTGITINAFWDHLYSGLSCQEFISYINNLILLLKKNQIYRLDSNIMRTMRMTINEYKYKRL